MMIMASNLKVLEDFLKERRGLSNRFERRREIRPIIDVIVDGNDCISKRGRFKVINAVIIMKFLDKFWQKKTYNLN